MKPATEEDAGLTGSSSSAHSLTSSVRELLSLYTQLHVAQLRQKQAVLSTMLEQLPLVLESAAEDAHTSFAWDIRSLDQRRTALVTRWAAELSEASQLHSDEVEEAIAEAEEAANASQKSFADFVDELIAQHKAKSRRRQAALEGYAKRAAKRQRTECWAVGESHGRNRCPLSLL